MRILYLFPRYFYEHKMSIGRVLYGEAMARLPGVSLDMWGNGWPLYDNDQSLSANLDRREREMGAHYDAIWLYKPEMHIGVAECRRFKFACYNEAWPDQPGRAMAEVRAAGIHLVIHHHAGDAVCFPDVPAVHLAHGAPMELYCETPASQRPVECLLSGVQSPEIYPLRAKYRELFDKGLISGKVRPHPGYRLESRGACRLQYAEYGRDLQSAKISLCCTSKYRYLLQKIVESMMAGCVVVTDAADDPVYREWFSLWTVEVSPDLSPGKLADVVRDLLSDPEYLDGVASSAREFVSWEYSMDAYARRLEAVLVAAMWP